MALLDDFRQLAENLTLRFAGREWLTQLVKNFLANPNSPCFLLIVGEPGIGKSAFAAHLWKHERIPDAVHFCVGGRGGTTDPLAFVESVAQQLADNVPGFAEALVEAQRTFSDRSIIINADVRAEKIESAEVAAVKIYQLEIRGPSSETAFDRVIRKPLCALRDAGMLRPVTLLVDSLDEAVTHTAQPHIVGLLQKASDLPARFILSSRPESEVLTAFGELPHILIDAQSEDNQKDIRLYLKNRFTDDNSLHQVVAEAGWTEAQFVDELGKASEWNFLYLNLVLPEIAAGTLALGSDTLPQGYAEYYPYLLSTRLGVKPWREWGRKLMEVTLALQEPVSLEQVAAYLAWEEGDTFGRLCSVRQLLDPALFEQERYWRNHWTVMNFLTERKQAGDFWCDERAGHARIADFCLNTWGGMSVGLRGLQQIGIRAIYDGYGLRHLVTHLEGAGRVEELHQLLTLETPQGRNAWFEAREATGQTSRYLDDIRRSWRAADEDIGLQCRYALIVASLNSLAASIPPALLAAMVENGSWMPEQGLDCARRIPDERQRAEAFARLAPHLPEMLLQQALTAALTINLESAQALALAGLAPYLPEHLLQKGLAAAKALHYESNRALALAGLAPHLPGPLLREALNAARAMTGENYRAQAMAGLLPQLAKLGYVDEALNAVQAINHEQLRAEVMAGIAPYLSETLLRTSLTAAEAMMDVCCRAQAQVGLLAQLARLGHAEEALAGALAIEWLPGQPRALAELAPNLPQTLLPLALTAVQKVKDDGLRVWALAKLASRLPEAQREDVLRQALTDTQKIPDEDARASATVDLAAQLPQVLLQEALESIPTLENEMARMRVIAGLAPYIPESKRELILQEALVAVKKMTDEVPRAIAQFMLAPHLSPVLLQQALTDCQNIGDEDARARTLLHLARYLPEAEREGVVRHALAIAQTIRSKRDRAEILVRLALYLSGAVCDEVLRQALADAAGIANEYNRALALAALAPFFTETLLREAWSIIEVMRDVNARAQALTALASRLAELGHIEEALTAVQPIETEDARVQAPSEMAPHWPEVERADGLRDALVAAQAISNEYDRAQALSDLAPRLTEPLLSEALASAQAIEREPARERALAGLIPCLAELGHIEEALVTARTIDHAYVRTQVLAELVFHLAKLPCQTLSLLWGETLPILATRTRADLLSDLATLTPVIYTLGGKEAIEETAYAILDVGRWWP